MLIDAGCEFSHYASDITRTFPVSGKFSDPQRDLYQAVLNVQKACIERCQVADEIGMNELHRISKQLLIAVPHVPGLKVVYVLHTRLQAAHRRAEADWIQAARW